MPTDEDRDAQIAALTQAQNALAEELTRIQQLLTQSNAGLVLQLETTNRTLRTGLEKLEAHLSSTDNPHATTAAQVGALAIGGGTLGGNLIVSGTITGSLAANLVGTNQLAANAVSEAKLADSVRNKLADLPLQSTAVSMVFGPGQNAPAQQGFKDVVFTHGKRIIAGWWTIQEDDDASDVFRQYVIGGVNAANGAPGRSVPTIRGNKITFRVTRTNNNPGLIRVLFIILFV